MVVLGRAFRTILSRESSGGLSRVKALSRRSNIVLSASTHSDVFTTRRYKCKIDRKYPREGGPIKRSFSGKSKTEDVQTESLEFQAETRQLLDIVTHSLYTDKEVFLRELISNASDSLEKLRHLQSTEQNHDCRHPDLGLEIRIDTDEVNKTISISDSGIGMNRREMIEHLGTIAKSGSKAFMNELAKDSPNGDISDAASKGIIGKFGVGFYSSFMVGDRVEVRSVKAFSHEDEKPLVWSSSGVGSYDISTVPDDIKQSRGATLVIHLKDDQLEYVDEKRVEQVLKKYSNFVNFPILLNGNRLNTVNAIWADDPKSIDDDKYSEFYKYIANAFDEPLDRLHYRADAPLDIKALFFIPSFHSEKVSFYFNMRCGKFEFRS